MADQSPLKSHSSPSNENDSIDEGCAQRNAAKNRNDVDFEDSLNVSISEHISEEIESMNNSSVVEDSIEKPAQHFDQLLIDKKRKLFDFDDSDKSETADSDGIRKFSKFDATNLDESLAGDNIAKHFLVEFETSAQRSSVNERHPSNISQCTKSDELKIANADEGAANSSKTNASNKVDEMQKSKDYSNLVELVKQSDAQKSKNSDEKNDVILINDQEISINSLKELQKQRSQSDGEPNFPNQNTTSDFSDLQNEDIAKEQRSIDDLSAVSINESSDKVESHSSEVDQSKSTSVKASHSKSESQSDKIEESTTIVDENIQKCRPIEDDMLPELSVIEEVSAADEQSSHRVPMEESSTDKKTEMRKIITEAVENLPLDKENRPPNLNDDVLSVDSKYLNSSQSNTTDFTMYNTLANFEEEVNLNFNQIQNKIKELHNLNAGRNLTTPFELPTSINSRRDSLKDFPQSGRESISITTNSTEYQPFQEEYYRVSIKSKHIEMWSFVVFVILLSELIEYIALTVFESVINVNIFHFS